MHKLNQHYAKYSKNPRAYLSLVSEDVPAEIIWWQEFKQTEFNLINELRNEAAVSFLALKEWDKYAYNNKAYTALYKLTAEDKWIEAYTRELERSTTNKTVGLILCLLLLISAFVSYYLLYIRKRIKYRWNLEQVLDINKKIFFSSLVRSEESIEALQREENALKEIPQKIVAEAYDSINELTEINCLGLAVYNDNRNRLEFASFPADEPMPEIVTHSFENQEYEFEGYKEAYPLIIDLGSSHQCVGVLYLEKQDDLQDETVKLLIGLVSRYVAIVIFNVVVKFAMKYRDIESAYENTYRASREDSMLHVQNLVLDNCLSTIKHETIYYPNKIKQIIDKLIGKELNIEEEQENINTIGELIEYYKGIFTILSANASRQLEDVTFRRMTIPVNDILAYADKYYKKTVKNKPNRIILDVELPAQKYLVSGDVNQLNFLFENLLDEALAVPVDGILKIKAYPDGDFIRFDFTDMRRHRSEEELNQLFYPNLERMTSGEKGELRGTEYLVCKQIIREHDEFAGRRGCRINAEPFEQGGFTVYFTIPKK